MIDLIIGKYVNMVLGNYELYIIKGDSIDDENKRSPYEEGLLNIFNHPALLT